VIRKKIHPVVQNDFPMNTWINQALSNEHATLTVLIAVFFMGMISVVTCGCNFAIIGVVAGYSGASSATEKTRTVWIRGITFLIGGILSMAIVGTLFGYASEWISTSFGNYWKIAAGLISILFGLYSMDLLPFKLPGISVREHQTRQSIFSAILFGLAIGGLSAALNSCCNPIFPVILAASFVKGGAVWGLMMLTSFGLGYGLPLAAAIVGFGFGLGKISKSVSLVGTIVKYTGGILLVLLGFYLLITI
jgi:cytochrome c biogenesis protein CcdA